MKLVRIFVAICCFCFPLQFSHAASTLDKIKIFAEKNNIIVLVHSPKFLLSNRSVLDQSDENINSTSQLIKSMNSLGYAGKLKGKVLSFQFDGHSGMNGLYVQSLEEYNNLFSEILKNIDFLTNGFSRSSLYCEKLVDTFSFNQRHELSKGIEIRNLSAVQYDYLNKWVFGTKFFEKNQKIIDSCLLMNELLTNNDEFLISKGNGDIITIKSGKYEFMLTGYANNSQQDVFRELFDLEKYETTLLDLIKSLNLKLNVNIELDDRIKNHRLLVFGDLKNGAIQNIIQSVVALGEWRYRSVGLDKFKIEPLSLKQATSCLGIDSSIRKCLGEYAISAFYGIGFNDVLNKLNEQKVSVRDKKDTAKDPKEFFKLEKEEQDLDRDLKNIKDIQFQFKNFVYVYISSRLSELMKKSGKNSVKISQYEKRILASLYYIDICGYFGPNYGYALPYWFDDLDKGRLYASFSNDGRFDRVSIDLLLPNLFGVYESKFSYSDALYHPDFRKK